MEAGGCSLMVSGTVTPKHNYPMENYRQTFRSYERLAINDEDWSLILLNPVLEMNTENINKADDWIIAFKTSQGYTKYGRIAYSSKLNQFRQLTMGEFYQTSPVD